MTGIVWKPTFLLEHFFLNHSSWVTDVTLEFLLGMLQYSPSLSWIPAWWYYKRDINMGWCTTKKHARVPTPVLQPFLLQLSFICSKQLEQVRLSFRWVECSEPCCSHLPQGPLGEQNSIFAIFLAIFYSIRYWTRSWWHNIPIFLCPLCIPSCWLVPSWYLLFQEFDPFVAFMFFNSTTPFM